MRNEFTVIRERDGDGWVAYCPEVTGANGQGRTKDEARASLASAIALILQGRREDLLRGKGKGNFRKRLKQGAMARAERDVVIAEEWFRVDERARARSVSFTQCREGMAPRLRNGWLRSRRR